MAQCDERFDPVFFTFVEHRVIKREARFIRLLVVPVRENTSPVDRQTEAFEAHFSKERNVFLVMMIEVDRFMARIKGRIVELRKEGPWRIDVAAQQHIRHRQLFSVF